MKAEFAISSVYLFGSFITGRLHEGSDIDVLVVGDFHDRFVDRIRKVLDLTDLPIEPLAYTDNEFAEMLQNHDPFLISILQNAHQLLSAAKES
ncbi:MAG TPA: nucleotidyltransferase domain-containing protein [Candidatus Lokiarchaeia archaeon]|nr:nucleotidyltransferase domain-containing protein [Candidatus Lokiarchaeia archaeon]